MELNYSLYLKGYSSWLNLAQWLNWVNETSLALGLIPATTPPEQIEMTLSGQEDLTTAKNSFDLDDTSPSSSQDDLVLPTTSLDLFLIQAVEQGDSAAVSDYLEQGADPSYDDNRALQTAILNNDTDIVLNLLQYGASL